MFDPSITMTNIQSELDKHVKELSKTKSLDDRIKLAEIIRNLTESFGVFLNFAASMSQIEDEGFDDEEF